MSNLTEGAKYEAVAERYAAELIDRFGKPFTYAEAVDMISAAYIAGAVAELKRFRAELRGDAA